MRISEHFGLNSSQPSLDFVDIDVYGDVRVFLDPRAIRQTPSDLARDSEALIKNFFERILACIKSDDHSTARRLLYALREPNETHLGLSLAKAQGRALGPKSADSVWVALKDSAAAKSGLLRDLEDAALLVPRISTDIISDIVTNIIRAPLIRYTQECCRQFGIPLYEVDSGPLWDPNGGRWYNHFVNLPTFQHTKLLFVPKILVRRRHDHGVEEYYRHFILEDLREQELAANTQLVHLLKNGTRRVKIGDLREKYPKSKDMLVRETLRKPSLLDRYRSHSRTRPQPPLSHEELAEAENAHPPNWDELFGALQGVAAGKEESQAHEHAIANLLAALLYPDLVHPRLQTRIHGGRKIIDITFENVASSGFFHWLGMHHSASHIFIECKNYAGEVKNPELDQLSGRFSPTRGTFGLLVCRSFENKKLFIKRCRDTAQDSRGFIVPLDDSDLSELVDFFQDDSHEQVFTFFKTRFDALVM